MSPRAAAGRGARDGTARERPPEEASIDTSFARGLRLLLMIADRGELRADELGSALERPVSTGYRYLRSKGNSIEGGTTEILRNIIAERILGLPGEIWVDKDVAWKDLPK